MARKKIIFKGRVFTVSKEKKCLPSGHCMDLEVIYHPGAVVVMPFVSQDKVILLKQFRPAINSYIYELPAGTIEDGENALACARREIVQETGYAASKFIKLGAIFPLPGYSTEKITIYKAQGLKKKLFSPEPDEIIYPFVFTRKQVRAFFKKGKIVDSKTICAFALCAWL